MTFATLLNGHALNTSYRFTFSEPALMRGEASASGDEPTKIRFVSGSSLGTATATGDMRVITWMAPTSAVGECVAPPIDAWRVTGVTGALIGGSASASGVAVRVVKPTSEAVSQAAALGSYTRFAYQLGEAAGIAASAAGGARQFATRPISFGNESIAGVATATPYANWVLRRMSSPLLRPRVISYNHEGLTRKSRVRQQYQEGTAIARAFSRATPNTILAFSISHSWATTTVDSAAIYVARDAVGEPAVAGAFGTGFASHAFDTVGVAVGTATGIVSPSVTVGATGVRYAYMQGRAQCYSSITSPVGIRLPYIRGVRLPASAELTVTQLVGRAMTGQLSAGASSASNPAKALVTHTVYATGRFEADGAVATVRPDVWRFVAGLASAEVAVVGDSVLWNAVAADSRSESTCAISATDNSIFTQMEALSFAEAGGTAFGDRTAYMQARTVIEGATLGTATNVARHVEPARILPSAQATPYYARVARFYDPMLVQASAYTSGGFRNATVRAIPDAALIDTAMYLLWAETKGAVGARRLRPVVLTHVGVAEAGGAASRNVFKINADDPAPQRRTLDVAFMDRALVIPDSNREYVVR